MPAEMDKKIEASRKEADVSRPGFKEKSPKFPAQDRRPTRKKDARMCGEPKLGPSSLSKSQSVKKTRGGRRSSFSSFNPEISSA